MRYYKQITDGYLTMIGTGPGGTEITAQEYGAIMDVITSRPTPPEGYGYKLKTDLAWEMYELPPEPEPEATQEDYMDALNGLGVNTDEEEDA